MKTQASTTAKRWLRSVDRATLLTMNPPASHALAAANRDANTYSSDHQSTDANRDAVRVDANHYPEGESTMTTIELDRELEELHTAAVWSLNAALESGWDDAAASIAKSYAAEERNLLRRGHRASAAA